MRLLHEVIEDLEHHAKEHAITPLGHVLEELLGGERGTLHDLALHPGRAPPRGRVHRRDARFAGAGARRCSSVGPDLAAGAWPVGWGCSVAASERASKRIDRMQRESATGREPVTTEEGPALTGLQAPPVTHSTSPSPSALKARAKTNRWSDRRLR